MHTKALHGVIPTFRTGLISPCVPRRAFASADKLLLEQPRYRLKSIGLTAFAVYAPYSWNCLPLEIKVSRMYYLLKKKNYMWQLHFFWSRHESPQTEKSDGHWSLEDPTPFFVYSCVKFFCVCVFKVISQLFSNFSSLLPFVFSLFIDMFGFTFVF